MKDYLIVFNQIVCVFQQTLLKKAEEHLKAKKFESF
jgi:hypothetical protein